MGLFLCPFAASTTFNEKAGKKQDENTLHYFPDCGEHCVVCALGTPGKHAWGRCSSVRPAAPEA